MNQILSTSNNQNNNKKAIDTKKIIVFFCAIIILFGIVIAGMSIYHLYKSKSKDNTVDKLNKPEIVIEQIDNGNVKVKVKYDQGINKVSYIWNESDRKDSNENGKTYIEKLIEMPETTTNKLEVIAFGEDGTEESITREFAKEGDTVKPVIDWVVTTNLQIIATDNTELDYLTYQWAGEEEVMIKADENDKTKIEKTIEIKRGTTELTVKAVDASGNIETKTRTFQGVKEPEISWMKYDDIVEMTITHDMGFKKIVFTINGKEYVYDSNYRGYNPAQTEVKFQTKLNPGDNTILIKAYSNEGSEKIKQGKATYNP